MNKFGYFACLACFFIALTPSAAWAANSQNTNLALHRPCHVFSTYEGDGWSKAKLTDGISGGLGWSSKGFSTHENHSLYPEYVIVDLGHTANIESASLRPRGDGANAEKGFPVDFTIQVCEEGEPWRTVAEKKNYPQPRSAEPQIIELANAKGRFLKVEATKLREAEPGAYRFQLAEIEIFGKESPAATWKPEPIAPATTALVRRLRCENRDNPVGMDAQAPRLSWWMESSARGQRQTAYRVLVASSAELLAENRGDFWDSGKVESNRSIAIRYGGKQLFSGKRYRWKVMLWDKDGKPVNWSEPAFFLTGKFQPEDWKGRWIGASEDPKHKPVYMRKEFEAAKPVKKATVFFSGLGHSELFIEGKRIGDYLNGPGFTSYDKRVQYLVFDVTEHFQKPGPKALGVILYDGWYALERDPWVHRFHENPYIDKPKLLLDLHLEYEDGTQAVVSSDASWRWTNNGPVARAWLCDGAIDRRLDMPSWNLARFSDKAWKTVSPVSAPAGCLVVQKEPPLKVVETLSPERIRREEATNAWVYDFDREFTGFVQLRISGTRGKQVRVVTLGLDPRTSGVPGRVSTYVFAGNDVEEFRPHFIYSSIAHVRIEGAEKPLSLDDLKGCRISSAYDVSGGFHCSNDLVNWLHESARRSLANYTTYLPGDSTREFKAWMEDPVNMFRSAVYLFDSQTMYERWQHDILDGQRPDGNLPNVAPGSFFDEYTSVWWGGTAVWTPWYWNLYYGDPQLLGESYTGMKRFVDFIGTTAKDSMIDWGLGDWMPVVETPKELINTPGYYFWAVIVSRTAERLNQTDDAKRYAQLAETIRSKFNAKFLDRNTGVYGPGTQAAQTLAIALGMTPEDVQSKAKDALLRQIAADKDHVSTGFVSTPYLLEILQDLAPELGYRMTTAQDYPSWYSMTAGADSDLMMEEWRGKPINMPSLGGNIAAWDVESLGGIRPDPAAPGFKKILIKPNIVGDLHWAECWYDSVHGRIGSRWRKRDGRLLMDVIIPANTTATVYIPTPKPEAITESDKPLSQAPGVTVQQAKPGQVILHVESGRYQFLAPFKHETP
jgi:alpha-L-rhamnosidase